MPLNPQSVTPASTLLSGRWVRVVLLGRKYLNGPAFTEIQYVEIISAKDGDTMGDLISTCYEEVAKNSLIPADLLQGFEFRFVNGPPATAS